MSNDTTAASLHSSTPASRASVRQILLPVSILVAVYGYQSGGYGEMEDINAFRLAGQLKSTNIFHAAGLHELKYGFDGELVQYGDRSGILGWTALARWCVHDWGRLTPTILCFGCPQGVQASQLNSLSDLLEAPYYQDAIQATTRQYNTVFFYRRVLAALHLNRQPGRALGNATHAGLPGQHSAVDQRQHRTRVGRDL